MELHPSGFLETGTCKGPRYIRNQPSRETSGTLLNEVTDKYVTEWGIPYTNILAYTKELNSEWAKLDQSQKDVISNSLSLFVYNNPEALLIKQTDPNSDTLQKMQQIDSRTKEEFGDDPTTKVYNYLYEDPQRLPKILDNVKAQTKNGVSMSSVQESKKLKEELYTWIYGDGYYKVGNGHLLVSVIILIIFLLIGVGIGYNC